MTGFHQILTQPVLDLPRLGVVNMPPALFKNTGSDILDRAGSVGLRYLGDNVRVPASMEEYYLPPDQRLYLPNQG